MTWPSGLCQHTVLIRTSLTHPYDRFFERIAKTYRREKWKLILRPMLSTWYACAQQLGDVELSVKLLVEMICHGEFIHAYKKYSRSIEERSTW